MALSLFVRREADSFEILRLDRAKDQTPNQLR